MYQFKVVLFLKRNKRTGVFCIYPPHTHTRNNGQVLRFKRYSLTSRHGRQPLFLLEPHTFARLFYSSGHHLFIFSSALLEPWPLRPRIHFDFCDFQKHVSLEVEERGADRHSPPFEEVNETERFALTWAVSFGRAHTFLLVG